MLLRYSLPQYRGTAVLPASTVVPTVPTVPTVPVPWYLVPVQAGTSKYHGTTVQAAPWYLVPWYHTTVVPQTYAAGVTYFCRVLPDASGRLRGAPSRSSGRKYLGEFIRPHARSRSDLGGFREPTNWRHSQIPVCVGGRLHPIL